MSSILLADPHPLTREALRLRLEAAGQRVLGETGDGREAVEQVRRLHPELLILDLELPGLGGLELIRQLHGAWRKTRLLVLTSLSGAYYPSQCLQAGVAGFVHKSVSLTELDETVRLVLGGRLAYPAQVEQLGTASGEPGDNERITPRELTVLRYLAEGRRVKDIADALAISDRTVSTYKTRLLEKTQTESLIDLVNVARAKGLLDHVGTGKSPAIRTTPQEMASELARLFDLLPSAISLRDSHGLLLACNRRHLELHGKTEEQLRGTEIFHSTFIAPGYAEQARREYQAGVAGKVPFSLQVPVELEGQRRILRVVGIPLPDADGGISGVLTSYEEVTEQEQYIEGLQEARVYFESLRSSRGAFLIASGRDILKEIEGLQGHLTGSSPAQGEDDLRAVTATLASLHEKVDLLVELVHLEQGQIASIPQAQQLDRLLGETLAQTASTLHLASAATSAWGWIDANHFRPLLKTLSDLFHHLDLPPLEVAASTSELEHGELSWRLVFKARSGEDIQARLQNIQDLARLHYVRHKCRLLGGELQIGSASQPDLAALIQIRLIKGSARN